MAPIITLTTDFGTADSFVGILKGVLLSICPDARLVDLCHDVPPQDVRTGALRLNAAARFFPTGTIHLAVVDPGVGTERRAIAAESNGQQFVGPDNGLLSMALALNQSSERWQAVELTEPRYWLPSVSQTFHGRDVFAPVAAHLAMGVPLGHLGPAVSDIVEISIPEPRWVAESLHGEIIDVDRFGNLISNIRADHLRGFQVTQVRIADALIARLSRSYIAPERFVALVSSEGQLEIAASGGNAAASLGVRAGEPVEVRCTVEPAST